jgi:hypothetical protein
MLLRVLLRKRRRPKCELVIHRTMDTNMKWNVRQAMSSPPFASLMRAG